MPSDEGESNCEAARLAARRLVATNVTELRVARQLSQAELARRSGVTERELEGGDGQKCSLTLSRRWPRA
jgi:DNA-binding transcriptional regulator YiaG